MKTVKSTHLAVEIEHVKTHTVKTVKFTHLAVEIVSITPCGREKTHWPWKNPLAVSKHFRGLSDYGLLLGDRMSLQVFGSPHGTATPNAIHAERSLHTCVKPAWQEGINTKFSVYAWQNCPERNSHTIRRQNRTAGRHDIFGSPHGTATPNAVHAERSLHTCVKPAWQEDMNTTFSDLRMAQLPRTQFMPNPVYTHPSNPHGRKTSTPNFRIYAWHSYPDCNLHTARRQTRAPHGAPGRRRREISGFCHGAATPNTVYTQQGAKPKWQENIGTKILHLTEP